MGSFGRRSRHSPHRQCLNRLLAVALGALCLTTVPERSPCQDRDNLKAVRDVIARQVAAWNSGSVEGYMQGYWDSDSTMFTSDGEITRGYERVLARYKKAYASRAEMGTLELSDVNVELLSPAVALATGVWKLVRKPDNPWGRFTLVFEKKPEGWRITHDHTSSAK